MKSAIYFLFLYSFFLFGCSSLKEFNEQIYAVQKQHLLQSPYKSANSAFERIEAQKIFRLKQLPESIKEILFKESGLSDTLLLLEGFDEICHNCPNDEMQVLYQDTLYYIEREPSGKKTIYTGKKIRYNLLLADTFLTDTYPLLKFHELAEIKGKMQRNENWNLNPLEYGSDGCLDGNHSLLTVIYPDGKIESMYVRCWWPEIQRKLREK